jgi:hypothetical protein
MILSHRRSVRRTFIPLLTLLVTSGIVGLTPIAQAASTNAALQIKGTGSVYTPAAQATHFVTLPASAGSAVSFAAKIINTGTTTAQFRLDATDESAQTVTYSVAGANATGLIDSGDGYFTPAVAPGKSIAITIKSTINKATTPAPYDQIYLQLSSTDGTVIDYALMASVLKAPSAATGPDQIFTKNGSGSYTGGPSDYVGSSGPALAVGGSTTFTAHVVNGGSSIDVIDVSISDQCTNYLITVKAGSTDETTAVLGGTYRTPSLAANGHLDLTIKVTYLGVRAGTPCDYDVLNVSGFSEANGFVANQLLFVDPAA